MNTHSKSVSANLRVLRVSAFKQRAELLTQRRGERRGPQRWLLSAFCFLLSALAVVAQNPITFQPGRRPSGSLNVTNVNAFSPEFTNFGGTISLVHPPPPGAVGTNDFNTSQFAWTTARKISIKSGALTTNLVMSGSPKITNNSDLAVLQFATSNHNASLGIDTASGQVELIGDNGFVFDSAIGSQLFKTAGSQWQLFGDTFSPGSSNLAHVGTALQPLADMWITDNQITATNGVLYLNGIPIVSSLWTFDSGTLYSDSILTNGGGTLQMGLGVLTFTNDDSGNVYSFNIYAQNDAKGVIASGKAIRLLANSGAIEIEPEDGVSSVIFRNSTTTNVVINADGSISIQSQTNLIGDNGSGITWNGYLASPWLNNGSTTFLANNPSVNFTDANGSLFVQGSENAFTEVFIQNKSGDNSTNNFFDLQFNGGAAGVTMTLVSTTNSDTPHNGFVFEAKPELVGSKLTMWPEATKIILNSGLGTLSLSGQTNLLGMSAGGQLTVDGVAVGGGSQTPWTSDIDASGFSVTNLLTIYGPVSLVTNSTGGKIIFNVYDDGYGGDVIIDSGYDSVDVGGTQEPVTINSGGGNVNLGGGLNVTSFVYASGEVNAEGENFKAMLRPGGGGQIRLSDTNGVANSYVNLYASTNSGSAVLYTEGSPPTATVPIDETSGAYVFPNTVTTNLVIPLVATIRITNGLVMAVTGP